MRVRVVLRTCFCCHQVGKKLATEALTCRGWYLIITKSNLQDGFMMHSAELCTESSQVLMKMLGVFIVKSHKPRSAFLRWSDLSSVFSCNQIRLCWLTVRLPRSLCRMGRKRLQEGDTTHRDEVVIRESEAVIKHEALHKTCDQKKAKYGQQERNGIKNTWEVKPFIIQAENGQREAHKKSPEWERWAERGDRRQDWGDGRVQGGGIFNML